MTAINGVTPNGDAAADNDIVLAFGNYLVMTKTMEMMLKKPDNDGGDGDGELAGAADQVVNPVAAAIAQAVTGFGE